MKNTYIINDIQKDTLHSDIQHNDIQHNDTQHNNKLHATLSITAECCYAEYRLSVKNKPFMLSVIMLIVIVMNVMAPF